LAFLGSHSFAENYQRVADVTGLAQAGAGLRNLATGNVSGSDLARATGLTGAGRLLSGDVSGKEFAQAAGVDKVGAGASRVAHEGLSSGVLNDASEALPGAVLKGAAVTGVAGTMAKVAGEINAANQAASVAQTPSTSAAATTAESSAATETVQRVMSSAELEATKETGLIRGGREGVHHVTDAASSDALRARQRLALDTTPEVKATLEVPKGTFSQPTKVQPANNMPGGGTERTATGNIPAKVVKEEKLK
jgi:hypothetical protein